MSYTALGYTPEQGGAASPADGGSTVVTGPVIDLTPSPDDQPMKVPDVGKIPTSGDLRAAGLVLLAMFGLGAWGLWTVLGTSK